MVRIDLSGIWSLTRVSDASVRPIVLPGDIISALLASGEIPDPYSGTNELELQWVGREDWLLARDFELDRAMAAMPELFFEAEVIDTVATVSVNGRQIAASRNMFRRLRVDLRGAVVPGRNRIEVRIGSPEKAAVSKAAALPYTVPYSTYPVSSPHRNLLRKEQCMSGWDWGPCLMTGGIYDSVAIVSHTGPRIEYARPRFSRSGTSWTVRVELDLYATHACSVGISALLADQATATLRETVPPAVGLAAQRESAIGATATEGTDVPADTIMATATEVFELPAGLSTRHVALGVESPRLWWPAGYGNQALYGLKLTVQETGAGAGTGHALDIDIGFRELEMVAEEDSIGRSMYFRVNGRDIFAKGANWIPADALPSRRTRARLESLLDSAVAANMNCLRVWGGGRYESEEFYQLCDEKGILLWQDCMFSCALYPSDTDFLSEVDAEIRHQVRRLQHHPSLALWCGNNEALGAIGWYEESRKNPARYYIDYDRLNEGVLGKAVRELDPDRTWWPSSPSAGPEDFSDNWHVDGRGDMHYWSVWHEGKPFSAYLDVKPRFCSEFGFQSFPSARTVAGFAPADQRNVTSPVMEHHQRHPKGNSLILDTMTRYFRMPSGFAATLYLSQVQQAMAIRTAVEWWRSLRPECMGTLYWQLGDVWPVASWSSLEYDGSWKLLHYEARRFYAPLHLALIEKGGEIRAVGMNDTKIPRAGRLQVRILGFDGSTVAQWQEETEIPADASTCLWRARKEALPGDPTRSFVHAEWIPAEYDEKNTLEPGCPASGGGRDGQENPESLSAWMFRTEPKRCNLPDPAIFREVSRLSDNSFSIRLSAESCAFHVQPVAATMGGHFSDAGFVLLPGKPILIGFEANEVHTAQEVEESLELWHLAASYR